MFIQVSALRLFIYILANIVDCNDVGKIYVNIYAMATPDFISLKVVILRQLGYLKLVFIQFIIDVWVCIIDEIFF